MQTLLYHVEEGVGAFEVWSASSWLTDEHWSCQACSPKVEKELWEKLALPRVFSVKANIIAMKAARFDQAFKEPVIKVYQDGNWRGNLRMQENWNAICSFLIWQQ